MNANISKREDESKGAVQKEVARRRIDFVLLALTLLGVAAYWPLLGLLPRVVRAGHPVGLFYLKPIVFMLVALCAALLWCWRGATRRSRLVWAVFVTLGLIGWPASCLYVLMADK